ncbi:hypothetical protein QJS10_CPA08g00112 [Acorus calamus]|uniref:TORTIFOLIA1/SINE1-2 N-terminal domain-containing protein n=1 Tax=Acorus calamus TaxID=4465 RepID=A0AAV9EDR6_ACOCL|nr:hypothetical protein QJS10_CPA08g00112 [Acorus calamus]
MGRNLNPALRQELANLDKDYESRKSAMKALKSYVKDLDSNAIPQFLAQVSETKEPGSTSGEYTISLYEVLARVHGCNIVPQIGNIMLTVVKTLSSSAGSFPLHQACARVVPAIARYGIDVSTLEEEKTRIISSLCGPLSEVLMSSPDGLASGAALCLKALVESDNWRFASSEMVNKVCLRVAGALEESSTQTGAHMGLAMALAKHNSLTVEAYARSLIRSGLHILSDGFSEGNSQKRLSAIQMINFFMKCIDSGSISSELDAVIEALEGCQRDRMPFVQGAAFEALQTARAITLHKGAKSEKCSSPIIVLNVERRDCRRRGLWGASGGGRSPRFASPESRTMGSFDGCDESYIESPMSMESFSSNFVRPTNRRLWRNEVGGVDVSLKDGLPVEVGFKQFENGEVRNRKNGCSEVFSGFAPSSPMNMAMKNTTLSPQRSPSQRAIDNIKIYTTPRKLVHSLQEPSDSDCENSGRKIRLSTASSEAEWNPTRAANRYNAPCDFGYESEEGRDFETLSAQCDMKDHEQVPNGSESVSSTCQAIANEAIGPEGVVCLKKRSFGKAAVRMICGLLLILPVVFLSIVWMDNDDFYGAGTPT